MATQNHQQVMTSGKAISSKYVLSCLLKVAIVPEDLVVTGICLLPRYVCPNSLTSDQHLLDSDVTNKGQDVCFVACN